MSSATLQDDSSVDSFLNAVETETVALLEHLSFEFLKEFDVFAPAKTGRKREHNPPELMCGFLHCYYKGTARLDLLYRFNRRESNACRSRRIEVLRSN